MNRLQEGVDPAGDLFAAFCDDGRKQFGFRCPETVNGPFRNTRLPGNRLHPGRGVAVFQQHLGGGLQDQVFRLRVRPVLRPSARTFDIWCVLVLIVPLDFDCIRWFCHQSSAFGLQK